MENNDWLWSIIDQDLAKEELKELNRIAKIAMNTFHYRFKNKRTGSIMPPITAHNITDAETLAWYLYGADKVEIFTITKL